MDENTNSNTNTTVTSNSSSENIDVSSYSIYDDASATVTSMNEKVNTTSTDLNTSKASLNKESVFMGPICDSSVNGFDKSMKILSDLMGILTNDVQYFQYVSSKYKSGDSNASNIIMNEDGTFSTTAVTGQLSLDGNVINPTNPVTTGNKYNLSDDDLAHLAYVAYREQGSVAGAKLELTLMANLYEQHKNSYSNVRDYVDNSGWFASGSRSGYTYPGDEYFQAAKDVMNNGNRYLASNVNEHDCISDISSISTGDKNDRSNYIPGQTVIHNVYDSTYTFVGFVPNGGDPFGYIS